MNWEREKKEYIIETEKRVLFVCAFAQSRSKWFAERFMDMGIKAMFCGHDIHADFPMTKKHIEWATEIVLLDKDIKRTHYYNMIKESNKEVLECFIQDEPYLFEKFLTTSGLEERYLKGE